MEYLEDGLILFWQTREDFDRCIGLFREWRAAIPTSTVQAGDAKRWEFQIIRVANQEEGQNILEIFRTLIDEFYDRPGLSEIAGFTLRFCAPTHLHFIQSVYQRFQEVRGGSKVF